MACEATLPSSGLSYACNVAFGGIQGIKIKGMSSTKVIEIEFNNKDGFSNYSEQKTVAQDGTIQCSQTLQIELPRLTKAKYNAIKKFSNPNMELIVYILTKSGKMITMGSDYGAYLQTSDFNSGTGRQDKNRIQLTFTADESSLARVSDSGKADYAAIVTTTSIQSQEV